MTARAAATKWVDATPLVTDSRVLANSWNPNTDTAGYVIDETQTGYDFMTLNTITNQNFIAE